MADYSLYERPFFLDPIFPIRITYEHHEKAGLIFKNHWHEQIELLYFTSGSALIKFNSETFLAEPGDLLIANSNELHYGESITDHVITYCIIIDTSVLKSSFIDYSNLNHSSEFHTLLTNKVSNSRYVNKCMNIIINEQEKKKLGYELLVKATVFKLIAFLIRNHANKTLSSQKYDSRIKALERLNKVLQYIEENYQENISVDKACRLTNLSPYYFCRTFKMTTGKTFSEYVNLIRINKAELLLKNTNLNITEIALRTGFNDINYFSRIFKKYKDIPPTHLRKSQET